MPSIDGPSELVLADGPPRFEVDPGENGFYTVEVATVAELFDGENHGDERDGTNLFGSRESLPLLSQTLYFLLQDAWQRLASNADRLYYRVWTSGDDHERVNPETSTTDERFHAAPFVGVLGDGAGPTNDGRRGLLAYLGFAEEEFAAEQRPTTETARSSCSTTATLSYTRAYLTARRRCGTRAPRRRPKRFVSRT